MMFQNQIILLLSKEAKDQGVPSITKIEMQENQTVSKMGIETKADYTHATTIK